MKFTKDDIRRSMLLYAVTDRTWLRQGQTLAQITEEVLRGGATFLQIREKELDREAFLAECRELRALAERYQVPFVVNDDVDLALACDADIQGRDIRALIGPEKILGITANTVELALAAQRAGADYIGVGAVFGTTTKKDAKPLSVAALREICDAVDIPVVAIGGINKDNLPRLAGSGVDGVAVVSALFAQPDPKAAAEQLRTLAEEMVKSHG